MKLRRLSPVLAAALLAIAVTAVASSPKPAAAHPLGNFTINALANVQFLGDGSVQLSYVLDMAEIPAFQELRQIDDNGDGLVSETESQTYLDRKTPELLRGLDLRVEGEAVPLSPTASGLSLPDGQGGLKTLRLTLDLAGTLTGYWQTGAAATLRDTNYADRIGWREVIISGADGLALTESSAAQVDETAGLTLYPSNRLKSPPNVRSASFRFQAGASSLTPVARVRVAFENDRPGLSLNRFAKLVSEKELTPAFIALSMLAAMAWGAAHALGPGHGKTIVGAYLVGSQGTAFHALLLGLTVTVTHTSSVIAVGLVTLFAAPVLPAEHLYIWLSVVSGLLVIAVAATLFATRLRSVLRGAPIFSFGAANSSHHSHSRGSGHHHHGADAHTHGHSHATAAPGMRGLLALGISGGLLPCPTALIVMLGAVALDRTVYGLALVLAFGVGLSAVLTGIGLILVYAHRLLGQPGFSGRFLQRAAIRRAVMAAPLLGSLVMLLAGLLITGRALSGVL
jgi:ABC-type nickel/cobalt efflux system permease component RcnA